MSAPNAPRQSFSSVAAVLTAIAFLASPTLADDFPGITNFSYTSNLKVSDIPRRDDQSDQGRSEGQSVSFTAFGRSIDLDLTRNDRLVADIRAKSQIREDQIKIFKGAMPSIPGSWARLSIIDNKISGVVWDGSEMLLIDAASNFPGLTASVADPHRSVVVRAGDIELPINDASPIGGVSRWTAKEMIQETALAVQSSNALSGTPSRGISLGLVLDAGFTNTFTDPVVAALVRLNIADGIFSQQLDLHLDVEHFESFDSYTDPFSTNYPEVLLRELQDLKMSNSDLAPLGLAHLLTRIDLAGATLGQAHTNSICGPDKGVGLTHIQGGVVDALVMAHEFGHNFGAPHDGESGPCQSTDDSYLMSPTVNGSAEFSKCSKNQMAPLINGASCLTAVETSELELVAQPLPPVLYYGKSEYFSLFVNSLGQESLFDGQLEITTNDPITIGILNVRNRDCVVTEFTPEKICELDNIFAGETVVIDAVFTPNAVGQLQMSATASASNDIDATNNTVGFDMDVLPAADVHASGQAHGGVLGNATIVGGTVAVTATIENREGLDTQTSISLTTDSRHQLVPSGTCTSASSYELVCDLGVLSSNSERSVTVDVLIDPNLQIAVDDVETYSVQIEITTSLHNLGENGIAEQVPFYVWGSSVDVHSGFVATPESVNLGETKIVTGFIANEGPDATIDSWIRVRADRGLLIGEVSAQKGICTPSDGCEIGALSAGERVEVTAEYTGTTAGISFINLHASSSAGLDSSDENDSARYLVEVIDPQAPQPKKSGGGGSTSIFWLVILGLCCISRRIDGRGLNNRD